jgi:peptidoglycan/LPS O-acetylase OafA/YrhL
METFLLHIGVNPTDIFAGFTGGMLAGLVSSGSRPNVWSLFCTIVVGTGAAAYLGPFAPLYVGAKPSAGTSFIIGLGGMPICQAIIKGAARFKWSPMERKLDGE